MAKAFLFVCVGILLLTVAYALGARTAGAQGGCGQMVGVVYSAWADCGGFIAIDDRGQAYESCGYNGGQWIATWSVPGRPAMITTHPHDGRQVLVIMENGDVYKGNSQVPGDWPPHLVGSVCTGGPTPAQQESFGSLKARYR